MRETLGEYIHKLRIENNLTLTKLAAALDIDQSTLSKIENNKRSIPEEILPKLAIIFKLDRLSLEKEFFSEKIALLVYNKPNCSELLELAEEKIRYIRQKSFTQAKLKV